MPMYPVDQKILNAKRKMMKSSQEKTPRTKLSDPAFKTSQGDLGIMRIQNPDIPRQVKAPTRNGDSMTNHVGKVASAMKKRGMLA